MSYDAELQDRVSKLEEQVATLTGQLEHVASMVTRYGIVGPGPAVDEEALLERVDALEQEVRTISEANQSAV